MSFKKKLAGLKDNYEKAREAKNTPYEINIENGKYRAALTSLELRESQSSGKLMVMREWTILEGDYADTVFNDFIHIESEWGMVNLHRFIEQAGYEIPDDPASIEEVLNAILGDKPECIIAVRIKDEFVNVRVREMLSADTNSEEEPEAEEAEEPEAEEPEAEDDGLAEMTRSELKAILKEEAIEFTVYKKTTDEAIIEAIREARGAEIVDEEPEAEEEEAEEEAEAEEEEVEEEPAPKKAAAKGTDKLKDLKNFCDANDVAYDRKKATEKSLIAAIKKGKYKAADMTPKEQKLLKAIGVVAKK